MELVNMLISRCEKLVDKCGRHLNEDDRDGIKSFVSIQWPKGTYASPSAMVDRIFIALEGLAPDELILFFRFYKERYELTMLNERLQAIAIDVACGNQPCKFAEVDHMERQFSRGILFFLKQSDYSFWSENINHEFYLAFQYIKGNSTAISDAMLNVLRVYEWR